MLNKSLIAAAIGLAMACAPAAGGTITAKFLGVYPGQRIHIHDGSSSRPLDRYARAGIYNLTIRSGTTDFSLGDVGDTFLALCVDVANPITTNRVYTWTVVDPSDAPNPTTYSDGHINAAELLALQQLLGAFPLSSVTTDQQAAALQAAVWEIVNESGGIYDVTSGNFIAGGVLNTVLANQMLATAASYQGPLPELKALTNRCAQDLIVIVPEPATLSILAGGMSVFAFHLRHRRR
jgi:hypothetical protein